MQNSAGVVPFLQINLITYLFVQILFHFYSCLLYFITLLNNQLKLNWYDELL